MFTLTKSAQEADYRHCILISLIIEKSCASELATLKLDRARLSLVFRTFGLMAWNFSDPIIWHVYLIDVWFHKLTSPRRIWRFKKCETLSNRKLNWEMLNILGIGACSAGVRSCSAGVLIDVQTSENLTWLTVYGVLGDQERNQFWSLLLIQAAIGWKSSKPLTIITDWWGGKYIVFSVGL